MQLNRRARSRIAGFLAGFSQVIATLSVGVPLFGSATVAWWKVALGIMMSLVFLAMAVYIEQSGKGGNT